MRQYLNTLTIATVTFFVGNFVGQTLDRLIFRDDYSHRISYQILSEDWHTLQSYRAVIDE